MALTPGLLARLRLAILAALAGILLLIAGVVALTALAWPLEHDSPLLHYVAWLALEHGRLPYRDVLITSMPGTVAFHSAIGGLLGWSDLAFQAVGLGFVGGAVGVVAAWLRPFGPVAVALGAGIFLALYLRFGPSMVLQRDVLGVVVASAGGALVVRGGRPTAWLLAGLAFGAAATIKPHLAVGLPVLWGLDVLWAREGMAAHLMRAGVAVAGALLPAMALAAGLAILGLLPAFHTLLTDLLPLHLTLGADLSVQTGWDRWRMHAALFPGLGGYGLWALLAGVAGAVAVRGAPGGPGDPERLDHRRTAAALLALAIAHALYVIPSGTYWHYHWMPFAWFLALLLGLVGSRPGVLDERLALPLTGALVILCLAVLRPPWAAGAVLRGEAYQAKQGRVDAIASWLDAHTEPGDRVLPIDWTAGALQAMHRARVVPPTPVIYTYMLHLHPETDWTRDLRARTLADLEATPPVAVVEVAPRLQPAVHGPRTDSTFPELRAWLVEGYRVDATRDGVTLWLRREPDTATSDPPPAPGPP
jgi:hypothetical protein